MAYLTNRLIKDICFSALMFYTDRKVPLISAYSVHVIRKAILLNVRTGFIHLFSLDVPNYTHQIK